MNNQYDNLFKFCLAGNSGAGKSSLNERFCDNTFSDKQTTLGVDFKIKTINCKGKNVKLQIWDTGQEKSRTLPSSYYKGVSGVIIVYYISDEQS